MMDVHRKKSVGEDSLLIFRQENKDMMEEDVPQSCSSPVYENMIREDVIVPYHVAETVVTEASFLPEIKFGEVGVSIIGPSIIGGDWARTQIGEASRVPDTYGVSIVGGETLETQFLEASLVPDTYGVSIVGGETLKTQFLEASHVPDTYGVSIVGGETLETQFLEASRVPDTYGVSIVGGETLETQFFEASHVPDTYGVSIVVGETLQNQFVEASLVPSTCGTLVDVLSSQHVRECQKSCLPIPDQVGSASTLIIPDIPTDRVVVNGLGSECALGKEPSENEGKCHVSVGLGESSLTPGGFTSLIQ
ncbi:hypothetical protein IFM89_002408 [Coptis chinensis]|uniref:Uncharacterized protein n=1 Tax=Coptis chinensis TaxID=261450 RepID=A0A835M3X1_9MAGN|nr:hypothetical protein IFM89_002408 [Coptis chinensis]